MRERMDEEIEIDTSESEDIESEEALSWTK